MPERQTERKRGLSVRKTPLAEEISIAGLRAQYDTHAKRLLSARPVLARILQKTVGEWPGMWETSPDLIWKRRKSLM